MRASQPMEDPNTLISLVGGPLCGEKIAIRESRAPNNIPMFNNGKFYNYDLVIEQGEFWTNIHYQYTNEIMEVNQKIPKHS